MPRTLGVLLVALGLVAGVATASAQAYANALAVGEGEVFISEPEAPHSKGTVYVYRPDPQGVWKEVARLSGADGAPFDQFGASVSYDGGRLLVGAPSFDSARPGGAYLFARDQSGAWRQREKLVPAGAQGPVLWGWRVLLQGDFAYIASRRLSDGSGAVTVYRRGANGRWNEEATLTPRDTAVGYSFGTALAADADRLLVGASREDSSAGGVFVFRRDTATGRWAEEARLPVRPPVEARFGTALLLHGDEALVSAPGLEGGTGAVLVLTHDAASRRWTERARFGPSDSAPRSGFGASLALVGDELWVGAPGADRQGRVYRFARGTSGGWVASGTVSHAELAQDDGFGRTLSGGSDVAVIGLPDDDHGAGTAVILARSGDAWIEGRKLWPESKGLESIVGAKRACTAGKVQIFPCGGVDLMSFLPLSAMGGSRGIQLSGNWGWTDPETGREYALVGKMDGTAFVEVTDPVHPLYLGTLPLTAGAPASFWRELKVYRNHLYVVSDGAEAHGMQVFDLTRLRNVQNAPANFTEDAHYDRVHSVHNIVIDTTTGFAYAVGSNGGAETCGGALHMIDIREPKAPKFAGCFADPSTGFDRTGYTHDAQCVVYQGPDQTYQGRQICFNSSETALGIADVTDKANPKRISSAAYPNVGYIHQGWLTDDHRYFYMDDEGDEISGLVPGTRTLIWDVRDLDEPVIGAEYIAQNKATDHNLYIKGNLMFQSNYLSGLRVYDISDRLKPVLVGYFDTVPWGEDTPEMSGAWNNYPFFKSGTIVVNSMQEGLFVLRQSGRTLIP